MRRRLAVSALALVAVVAVSPASGSELLQDPNVTLVSLGVNGKGEAP
jgi:hypothetical protein